MNTRHITCWLKAMIGDKDHPSHKLLGIKAMIGDEHHPSLGLLGLKPYVLSSR
jgi:hypothetical protein